MDIDYVGMAVVIAFAVCLLLVFVKRDQIRPAVLALFLAQLFSWPITLLYAQFGLQENPVRLFPHSTESNFLFAFIFHPAVFVVYYLHYPRSVRKALKRLYTFLMSLVSPLALLTAALLTNLVSFPYKVVLLLSYSIILMVYPVSRRYLDRYFLKLRTHGKGG